MFVYINITIDGNTLALSEKVKNLGILIDENLKFEQHINKCIGKAYASLRLIYSNRKFINRRTKRLLCDSLVLSHFNYGAPLYYPFLSSVLKNRIQKVQNSCLRLLFGLGRRDHVSCKLTEADWLNMNARRLVHATFLFRKIIVTERPAYLFNKISIRSDVHTLNIRFKGTLTPPMHKTEFFKNSFSYQITKIYNSVSARVGLCTSERQFRFRVRELGTRGHFN